MQAAVARYPSVDNLSARGLKERTHGVRGAETASPWPSAASPSRELTQAERQQQKAEHHRPRERSTTSCKAPATVILDSGLPFGSYSARCFFIRVSPTARATSSHRHPTPSQQWVSSSGLASSPILTGQEHLSIPRAIKAVLAADARELELTSRQYTPGRGTRGTQCSAT